MMNSESRRNEFAYDAWASDYDRQIPPHASLEQSHFVQMVGPRDGDRILDLACGTGRLTEIWSKAGASVVGVDVSRGMLERARLKIPETRFLQLDLNGVLPFENGLFNKVSCSLAIKHIRNLSQLFEEVFRISTPDGIFVFSTIHPQMDWSSYERREPSTIDVNVEGENFPYTIDEIQSHVVQARWKIAKSCVVYADDSIRPFLSPKSFERQRGLPYVWIQALRKS